MSSGYYSSEDNVVAPHDIFSECSVIRGMINVINCFVVIVSFNIKQTLSLCPVVSHRTCGWSQLIFFFTCTRPIAEYLKLHTILCNQWLSEVYDHKPHMISLPSSWPVFFLYPRCLTYDLGSHFGCEIYTCFSRVFWLLFFSLLVQLWSNNNDSYSCLQFCFVEFLVC